MNSHPFEKRLAVCSWSLQPATPQALVEALLDIGIPRVQLALDPLRENPAVWGDTAALLKRNGIDIVSGMFGTIGEDYSTLDTIRATGGVVPDATWAANWSHIQHVASIAADLGLKLVTFHAGFLPHEKTDPDYIKLSDRIRQIGRLFNGRGIDLGFETGQETADTLKSFLAGLGEPGVGVNFDPANMILYDKGDPIQALRTLGPWLKQCHIKDANRTRTPGTWGEEVVVGTGQVPWKQFLSTLAELGYHGTCAIEREAGTQRIVDIKSARSHLLSIA